MSDTKIIVGKDRYNGWELHVTHNGNFWTIVKIGENKDEARNLLKKALEQLEKREGE